MNKLTIVSAQINLLVGDIEGNAERIITTANDAYRQHQADIVLFPELAITSYPPEDLLFRPALYQRAEAALQHIKNKVKNTTVVIGYPACENGSYYNKAAVIRDDKIIASYAKHELPNYRVFDEKRYFTPGTEPCVIEIKGTAIGVLICSTATASGPWGRWIS